MSAEDQELVEAEPVPPSSLSEESRRAILEADTGPSVEVQSDGSCIPSPQDDAGGISETDALNILGATGLNISTLARLQISSLIERLSAEVREKDWQLKSLREYAATKDGWADPTTYSYQTVLGRSQAAVVSLTAEVRRLTALIPIELQDAGASLVVLDEDLTDARKEIASLKAKCERLKEALEPFAAFAEKAESFVSARAKDGGSPILPVTDFRLSDFSRAKLSLTETK